MNLTLHHEHPWDVTTGQATEIQRQLASLVRAEPMTVPPTTIAGVDVSVHGDEAQAAVAVLAYPSLDILNHALWRGPVAYPYVSGLLSFREVPAVLRALEQLPELPDLIMADAQGIAHPRRVGMAAHLGILLDVPVIGVAKSRLVGEFVEPDDYPGARSPLLAGGEQLGEVVRTRAGVKPLFISIGHRVTLAEAVALVLACCTRYRLPEPTRQAHLLSRDGYTPGVTTVDSGED
ncbi:MAG: deoxyribonuclease V [Caldilineaceae bacterium]